MAAQRKVKEPVPDYPSLFGELAEEDPSGAEVKGFTTSGEARRASFSVRTSKNKPTEYESRQKRNTRLWESLYPTPNKIK